MRPRDFLRNTVLAGRNLVCSLRRTGLDWLVLSLQGSCPERTVRRDPLPFPFSRLSLFPHETSLQDVQAVLEAIGQDRRVQGVVLRFDGLRAGASTLHSLRRMVLDLRATGKRIVAWLPTAGTWDYYLASACNEVILPPSGHIAAMGLRVESLFLKDALALAGVEADLEAIAEYKVTPDTFRRSAMSEPHRQMLDAMLDSLFDEIVATISEGRGMDPVRVRELIDAMPLTSTEAVEAGLADATLYEDELTAHVGRVSKPAVPADSVSKPAVSADSVSKPAVPADSVSKPAVSVGSVSNPAVPAAGHDAAAPALLTWHEAARWLRRPVKWTTRQVIGVVSLEGLIVPGHSRRVPVPLPLPFGEIQAGAETIVQALRGAEDDRRIAAIIFVVETPGGSALASDLIWREVYRLRDSKPVVVLMGGQATSGGYYVAAPANRIVARPTTLTGSIGIWGGKMVLGDLYRKLGIGRESVQRGAMAGLYSEMEPFGEEERARVRRDMGETYARFKARVVEGRDMTEEQVEAIARGRVWTGVQAREIGLVDELGDFETALAAAKELAGLEPDREYTVVDVPVPRHGLLPRPFPLSTESQPTEVGLGALLDVLQCLARERVWALAPWTVRMWG